MLPEPEKAEPEEDIVSAETRERLDEGKKKLATLRELNGDKLTHLNTRMDGQVGGIQVGILQTRLDGLVDLVLSGAPEVVKLAFELQFESSVAELLSDVERQLNLAILTS